MTIVESISNACKELGKRVGADLKVAFSRAWPYDGPDLDYIAGYDITC